MKFSAFLFWSARDQDSLYGMREETTEQNSYPSRLPLSSAFTGYPREPASFINNGHGDAESFSSPAANKRHIVSFGPPALLET
jgi:hypothetical protein